MNLKLKPLNQTFIVEYSPTLLPPSSVIIKNSTREQSSGNNCSTMPSLYDQSRIAREQSSIPVKNDSKRDVLSLTYSFSEVNKSIYSPSCKQIVKMQTPISTLTGFIAILVVQIIFGIVFGAFSEYGKELLPTKDGDPLPTNLGSYPREYSLFILNAMEAQYFLASGC